MTTDLPTSPCPHCGSPNTVGAEVPWVICTECLMLSLRLGRPSLEKPGLKNLAAVPMSVTTKQMQISDDQWNKEHGR